MSHTKLYAWIYVVLFVFATIQVAVEYAGLLEGGTYWIAFGAIMVLSAIKAVLVAGYYQHLRWEPASVTYLVLGALLVVVALVGAASFSIL